MIKTSTVDKQIMARKEQVNLTKHKIEILRESIIDEFRHIFSSYIDAKMISIIKYNADIINEIPAEKLTEFKKAVLVAKENSIKRVIDEISESQDWFSCEKRGIDIGGGLWRNIKSIEKEFLPLFNDLNLKRKGASVLGATDLTPLNLDAFQSKELLRLNDELNKILEDYCSKEDSLKELQNSFIEKKAVERWQNTGNDRDEKSITSSKNQLDY